MEEVETKTIFELIPKVMADVGHISKGKDFGKPGTGSTHYKYRGIDDVFNAFQTALSSNGVFYVPQLRNIKLDREGTKTFVSVEVEYVFYGPEGDHVTSIFPGEAIDYNGDKATNKAMQAALKYMMLQMFCVPTEDQVNDDADAHGHAPKSSAPKSSAAKTSDSNSSRPQSASSTATAATPDTSSTALSAPQPSAAPAVTKVGGAEIAALLTEAAKQGWTRLQVGQWMADTFKQEVATVAGNLTPEQYQQTFKHMSTTRPVVATPAAVK